MIGILVLWNDLRAFGFIQPEDADGTNDRVFAHMSHFVRGSAPYLGVRVEYELGPPLRLGQKQQAVRIKILPPEPAAGIAALLELGRAAAQQQKAGDGSTE